MKILPNTIADKVNAKRRIQLANWLREWALAQSIRLTPSAELTPATEPGETACAASGVSGCFQPEAGQIVLLRPVSAAFDEGRPLFVLVLREERDLWLAAPFSRFAAPATDREWKTGLRARPLRVLCFWNARRISGRALSTGWLCAHVSSRQHVQALKAFEDIQASAKCDSGRTSQNFGPPLRHPLDPRQEYLAEEAALLDEHLHGLESQVRERAAPFLYEQHRSPLLKAAENRSAYGRNSGRSGRGKRKRT